MKGYTVFVRNWWKKDRNGDLVPDPLANKSVKKTGLTLEEAQKYCKEWNETHNPGVLDRKAEYTSNF